MIEFLLAGQSLYEAARAVAYQRRQARQLCGLQIFRDEYERGRFRTGRRTPPLDELLQAALAEDVAARIPAALRSHVAARLNKTAPSPGYVLHLHHGEPPHV